MGLSAFQQGLWRCPGVQKHLPQGARPSGVAPGLDCPAGLAPSLPRVRGRIHFPICLPLSPTHSLTRVFIQRVFLAPWPGPSCGAISNPLMRLEDNEIRKGNDACVTFRVFKLVHPPQSHGGENNLWPARFSFSFIIFRPTTHGLLVLSVCCRQRADKNQ